MIRYKFLYFYYRIQGNSPCTSRGKVARFITRNVKTSIEQTLEELWDKTDIKEARKALKKGKFIPMRDI